MQRKVATFAIILLALFLVIDCKTQAGVRKASEWSKFAQKLNPGKKTVVIIADKQMGNVFANKIRRYGTFCLGFGYGILYSPRHYKKDLFRFQSFIHSSHPLIVLFSPDQLNIPLEKIPEKYHFLWVIRLEKVRRILEEGKCLIVSKWEKKEEIEVSVPGPKNESTPRHLVRGERYLTLITAPDKKLLLDAIARFFSLDEIPLEPIIWKLK